MASWVVPTIAADLWGMPLDQILGRIKEGSIPARTEHGFMFVNVTPYGDKITRPNRPRHERPPTYVVPGGRLAPSAPASDPEPGDVLSKAEVEALESDGDMADWRSARRRMTRLRRPPGR